MKKSDLLGNLLMGVCTLCAVVVTSIVVKQRLSPSQPGSTGIWSAPPVMVDDWEGVISAGRRIGPASAKVTLVEFADFQCPACRRFAEGALRGAMAEFPGQISLVFRHWPLPYHKFAYPAARASECAAVQGGFDQFVTHVYEHQDSLGTTAMRDFAARSGVSDLTQFDKCFSDTIPVARIEADMRAVRKLEGRGTPTLVLNGRLLPTVPDSVKFHELITELLDKKE